MRILIVLLLSVLPFFAINCSSIPQNPEIIAKGSWFHFKRTFIQNGRVFRPKNNSDTVSEGQAYGMLRAVLMNDRKTFDECLVWTEAILSRKVTHGDRLLAWHYENGKVSDTKSASDADIDYAYSLILAHRTWGDERYLALAREVLKSVLELETTVINGKLYFLPWPKEENSANNLTELNPSYYAPSHFKLFYEVSGDRRWLELADTTYNLLARLLGGELQPGGIVPDWVSIDEQGQFVKVPGKPAVYGWDAVRVPLRIAADFYLTGDSRALDVLRWFSASFEKKFTNATSNKSTSTAIENALFYSAEYAATEAAGSAISGSILQRLRECIRQKEDGLYYNADDDYYINSLSWLPEYYQISKITNSEKSVLPYTLN